MEEHRFRVVLFGIPLPYDSTIEAVVDSLAFFAAASVFSLVFQKLWSPDRGPSCKIRGSRSLPCGHRRWAFVDRDGDELKRRETVAVVVVRRK